MRIGGWLLAVSACLVLILVLLVSVFPVTRSSFLTAPTAHADGPNDWPMFRHDPARTGYNPDETQLRPPLRLKWTYATENYVRSSPVVAGSVVYVGSQGPNFYALDAATGASRWTYTPYTSGDDPGPAPAVAHGLVYVGYQFLYALDAATGALRWSYSGQWNSSPTVSNGVLFGSNQSEAYALDATTGAVRWRYSISRGTANPSPAVANGMVYVGSGDDKVYALDAATGALKWTYTTANDVESSPAVANGVVYVGSNDRKLYALEASTGALRWSYTTGGRVNSSPAVANGVVYVGSNDGKVYALEASTGAVQWSYATGWVDSSPAVANGVVYVGSNDGKVYALEASTGAVQWSYATGWVVRSSPAVANGVVYVGSTGGNVYAFEAQPPPVSQSVAPYAASASFTISWTVPITWTGTAAGSYDVQYRDGPTGAWTDLLTSTTSTSTTFTGQDGHTYYFRARATTVTGAVGDWSEPVSTTVDLTPPTGSLAVQGWSSPYISNTVSLSISASDGTSGMSQMQFGSDGLTFNPWESYGTASLYVAPPGATAVYGRFKDKAGNVSQPVSATIALDNVSPTGSVSINGGATYATSMTATLALSATDGLSGVSNMALSTDGTGWSEWQGYATAKSWLLAAGPDGPRTVYTRFRDAAQNVSPVYSDTIILDTAAPTGTVTINSGASDTNSQSVVLSLTAGDERSGVSQMSFSNDGQNYSSWQDYATSRLWNLLGGNGPKTVYARYKDVAGNISPPVTATIYLNTTQPSSGVIPLSAYQGTPSFTVSWSGSALGNRLASFDIQYKDGSSGTWTDWITGTLSTSAVFTGTEGHSYYFQSRARDLAGNVESYVGGEGHTRTTVDLTPPVGTLTINGGALDTTTATVTLVLSATDSLSGVSQAAYSNDGSSWSAWESYAAARSWTVPTGDGEKAVWARFRDAAGNVSSSVSDTIRLDTTVAAAYGFSVSEGALFTSQVTVTLSLPANPNTAQMMLSNDGGFYGATWEPYAAYRAWAITQYGSYVIARTVYVKYKDVSGNVSGVYQDEIILDVNAPSGSVSIEGAGAASRVESRGSRVETPMPATSVGGGDTTPPAEAGGLGNPAPQQTAPDFSLAKGVKTPPQAVATTSWSWPPPGGDGPRLEAVATGTATPPHPHSPLSVNGEGVGGEVASAAATTVTLRLSATDSETGVGGMMVSNSPAFSGSSWEPFKSTRSWSVGAGGKVYAVFKDYAGNASPIYSAALTGAKESLPSVVLGTVHPKTGGAISSSETGASISFPPGAFAYKTDVTWVPAVESSLESGAGNLKSLGKFMTLTAKAGDTDITTVSKAYTITVSYAASDIAGIDEATLSIFWWNGSAWAKESGSRVDTVAKTVSAAIDHFSSFAVLGESTTKRVYLPLLARASGGW